MTIEKEIKLKENEVLIGGKVMAILPVKIKYMKTGFYANYMTIKQYNFAKLLTFLDAEDIIKDLLRAVLDIKEIDEELYDNLDAPTMGIIMKKIQKINSIEDEIDIKNE